MKLQRESGEHLVRLLVEVEEQDEVPGVARGLEGMPVKGPIQEEQQDGQVEVMIDLRVIRETRMQRLMKKR